MFSRSPRPGEPGRYAIQSFVPLPFPMASVAVMNEACYQSELRNAVRAA